MMPSATPMLPHVDLPGPVRVHWFSGGGSVESFGEEHEVRVRGTIIGRFQATDAGARNAILVGLAEDPHVHLGQLAAAFKISEEMLRQIRRRYEREGLQAVIAARRGGRERIVDDELRARLVELFEAGLSVTAAYARVQEGRKIGRTTVAVERRAWARRRVEAPVAKTAAPAAAPSAQTTLPLASARDTEPTTGPAPAVSVPPDARDVAASEPSNAWGQVLDDRPSHATSTEALLLGPARGAGLVQHVGSWLLLGQLARYPLHEVARKVCDDKRLDGDAVRLAIDAVAVALAQGEHCVEGVRRLATSSAPALLSTDGAPSADWVRTTLGHLASHGSDALHTGVMRRTLALARAESGPAVFLVDNHLRPYTGEQVLRRGWRMQAKRVVPGTMDYYVHNSDGRPLLRMTSPTHASLPDVLLPIADTIRATLGEEQRLLFVFDRGGAFPDVLASLRNESYDFVTYERRPFRQLLPTEFVRELVLEGEHGERETVRFAEFIVPLRKARGDVRRIAMRTTDERQVNLLAISALPAERLIEIIGGRWCQENGFKHGVERWGLNHLDGRRVLHFAPDAIVPNPARRRLDHALRLARAQEGIARSALARLAEGDPEREQHHADLDEALAMQEELYARRAITPARAPLSQTELAGKLVYHRPDYKLVMDTIRIACANAEEDLVELLAPYLPRAAEAKKTLAVLFAAPGRVRFGTRSITVALDPAGTGPEREAYARFYARVNAAALSLPGDPRRRRLTFRSQLPPHD